MNRLLNFATERGIATIFGEVLRENENMLNMARDLGFSRVGVQSNGACLDVAALADAGLTVVHLSLYGARAGAHDWVTRRQGSFDLVLRALGAARRAEVTAVVATVVTRSTFRGLAASPPLPPRSTKSWHLAGSGRRRQRRSRGSSSRSAFRSA